MKTIQLELIPNSGYTWIREDAAWVGRRFYSLYWNSLPCVKANKVEWADDAEATLAGSILETVRRSGAEGVRTVDFSTVHEHDVIKFLVEHGLLRLDNRIVRPTRAGTQTTFKGK